MAPFECTVFLISLYLPILPRTASEGQPGSAPNPRHWLDLWPGFWDSISKLQFSVSVLGSPLEWASTIACVFFHILFRRHSDWGKPEKDSPAGGVYRLRQGSQDRETPTVGRASVPGTDSPPGRKVAAGPQPLGHEQPALIENRNSEAATNFPHSTGQENYFCRFCVSQPVCALVRDLACLS